MKVLLVNGSPHKEGCTYTALCEVSKALNENGVDTDIFWIGNKALSGCIACKKCRENNRCVFNDSVNEFLEIAGDYDGFVFGTPVHWGGASGAITSFLDRAFYADLNGGGMRFRLKPAAVVTSARRAGTTATQDQVNKYFGLMEMPIVTSRYWNMVHGTNPEEVKQDLEGMQVMRVLGNNMAFLINCKNVALKMGLEMPKAPDFVFTNFIHQQTKDECSRRKTMNSKKLFSIILAGVTAIGLMSGCGSTNQNSSSSSNDNKNENKTAESDSNVAETIAQVTGGDLFEIESTEPYTDDDLDWTNDDSRVSREHEDESLRDVELTSTDVPDWDSYDTVYIGA